MKENKKWINDIDQAFLKLNDKPATQIDIWKEIIRTKIKTNNELLEEFNNLSLSAKKLKLLLKEDKYKDFKIPPLSSIERDIELYCAETITYNEEREIKYIGLKTKGKAGPYVLNENYKKKLIQSIKYEKNQEIYKKEEELNAIQILENKIADLPEVEKEQVIKARIGQGLFREILFKDDNKCKICGLDKKELLIASHILPWRECKDGQHLNQYNGFLLCPNHDALFDKGYISFKDDGEIKISKILTEIELKLLNLKDNDRIELEPQNLEFLKWHRENLFQK